MTTENFKSGFISILGKPNVGKSTLMNGFMKDNRFSIVTPKAQTTRHRIMGILTGDNYQLVISDTPGVIEPKYKLQESMMRFVNFSLEDADIVLLMVEPGDENLSAELETRISRLTVPIFLIINKMDAPSATPEKVAACNSYWQNAAKPEKVFYISALKQQGVEELFAELIEATPVHPAYYDTDFISDRPERFFAAEMIREQLFLQYKQEIPYSCEVSIDSFKEEETILRIRAIIYTERPTQKSIIIGKGGIALKAVGIEARKGLEEFFGKQVFLETFVKVDPDWRNKDSRLKNFGYQS